MMRRDGMYSLIFRVIWFEIVNARPSLTGGGASPEFYRPVDSQRAAEDAETTGNAGNVCNMIVRGKNAATTNDVLIKYTASDVPSRYGAEAPV